MEFYRHFYQKPIKLSRFVRFFILLILFPLCSLATDNYYLTKHSGSYPSYPKIHYANKKQAKLIQRGEYLVKMGDCIACHTQPGGKAFAGGLAIKTPFGIIYTPNITPDKKVGIGDWSFAQFKHAFQQGINPKGQYYYPAFPYPYFNRVKPADVKAIWAYLQAIPAIDQKNRQDAMRFPFDWRFLQLGWRILFFHKDGPYQNNPKESKPWNRGAYLVKSLGHCSMCHTPSYHFIFKKWSMAAPIQKYYLTGAMVEGFYAPNISATNLKNYPTAEIANVFLKDRLLGGGQVQGPMAEANHDSLKYLTQADATAIAIYLKSVKSQAPPRPHLGNSSVVGKKIYGRYCASCHSTGIAGAPKFGDAKDWAPKIKLGLNKLYFNAIHGINAMPPKGTCASCTDAQIQAAVRYMVDHSQGKTSATTPAVKASKKLTLKDGAAIYQRHCSVCHDGADPNAPKLGDKAAWKPIIAKGFSRLLLNAIKGYKSMPARGGCTQCDDATMLAAVKYMVHKSKTSGNYSLW